MLGAMATKGYFIWFGNCFCNDTEKLFAIIDTWQKINTNLVCFGAEANSYGAFIIPKTGHVKAMKLVHKWGSIKCNQVDGDSYWGCVNSNFYNSEDIMTIITNVNRDVLLPPAEDLKSLPSGIHVCGKKHFYTLEGIEQKSPELVFRNLKSPMPLSQGEELQIWYGQDFADCGEEDNSGVTCVDVYAWYI